MSISSPHSLAGRAVPAVLLIGLVLATVMAQPSGADITTDQPVDRLIVISLPTVAWADLEEPSLPNLEGLLDESAIGDLSTRAVVRRTSAGDGYTTLNAGTRARGARAVDGLAFTTEESFAGGSATEAFTRRTGEVVEDGVMHLGLPQVLDENADLDFGAEVGALGDALADAGVPVAVVANADGADQAEDSDHARAAALGVMTSGGVVPGGDVSAGLLVDDPQAPFGRRLDLDAVESAFVASLAEGGVVMVEASDLVRADAYRSEVTPGQRRVQRAAALRSTDELVGRLLDNVDPERDAVLVVGPFHGAGSAHLTIAGVRAPGIEPGLLKSAVTRRSGFVTLVDVAPTILDLVGVERPDSMEGRPFERSETGGSTDDRRAFLAEADAGAQWRDRQVAGVAAAFVLAQLALWLASVWALRGSHPRRRVVRRCALATLAFLPMTYVAGLFPFHEWGAGPFWLFLLTGAVVLALIADRFRGWPADPLIVVLGANAGLLMIDILVGGPLQLNTVFGYTPTVAGRFAGLGNLAFAQLVACVTILAGLVASRWPTNKGAWAGVSLVVAALIVDGSPFWGSDVGGVLTLVPTLGAVVVVMFGLRPRLRTVVLWAGGAVALMVVAGLIDLARPEESRTHLGRLFEDIGAEGFGALETVIVRKIGANLAVLTTSEWTLMLPIVFAFILYLIWRAPGRLEGLRVVVPQERAGRIGFVVAAVIGFAVNDSGIAIPGLMLGVMNASLVFLIVRADDPPWSEAIAAASDQSEVQSQSETQSGAAEPERV